MRPWPFFRTASGISNMGRVSINHMDMGTKNVLKSRYLVSWHPNNPGCSVTVVKLARHIGDDHFLLLMPKGVGGLADPLPYHFPQSKVCLSHQCIRSKCSGYG